MTEARGPLAGIRVIDLTMVVLGPYLTQILGDMGAEVIKVEAPSGDVLRGVEPARSPGMGAIFLNVNRNKRSLCLDLKQPAAQDTLHRLVGTADVFVHSLRPRSLAKLGIDYPRLSADNPGLIYCNAVGFGRGGRYADRPAYDDIIQAASGVADLPRRSGQGDHAAYLPTIMADKTAALHAAYALSMALFHRERTGAGQELEVPMFETVTAFNLLEHLAGHAFDPPAGDMGYARLLTPNRRPYPTADGELTVMPYDTRQWQAFFRVAGRPDMVEDPRVTDPAERSRNIGVLYGMLATLMPERTTAAWMADLEEANIPAMPVQRLEDLPADPHLGDVGFFERYQHPSEGPVTTTAVPIWFSATPGSATRRPPPRLGEHTREILAEAGLTAEEIARLVDTGAAIPE